MDKFTVCCCWILQFTVLALVCTSVYVRYVVLPKAESLAMKQFHCFEVISYEAMAFVMAAFVAVLQFYEGLIVSPILLCDIISTNIANNLPKWSQMIIFIVLKCILG